MILSCVLLLSAFGLLQAALCPSGKLTDEERNAVLNAHNSRRSNIALGREPNRGGRMMPAAKEMYKMTYDCEVERSAQSYADQCRVGQHSNAEGVGENLYWSTSTASAGSQLSSAASLWWKELSDHGVNDPSNRLTVAVYNAGVGHFTQMAWWDSNRLGCGVSRCSGQTFVVCQYKNKGNFLNQPIYPTGSPCSCTRFPGSVCSASEGLCLDPVAQGAPATSGGREQNGNVDMNEKQNGNGGVNENAGNGQGGSRPQGNFGGFGGQGGSFPPEFLSGFGGNGRQVKLGGLEGEGGSFDNFFNSLSGQGGNGRQVKFGGFGGLRGMFRRF